MLSQAARASQAGRAVLRRALDVEAVRERHVRALALARVDPGQRLLDFDNPDVSWQERDVLAIFGPRTGQGSAETSEGPGDVPGPSRTPTGERGVSASILGDVQGTALGGVSGEASACPYDAPSPARHQGQAIADAGSNLKRQESGGAP